ncbi:MAG: AsmA-like C-terminal region-containing protein [Polaribacter sp.]|nr:AsmA-like C-terminal region-containing protein [Polaribacter sp.]
MTKINFDFKRLKKVILYFFLGFLLLFITTLAIVYLKKDAIISKVINHANTTYKGLVIIDKTTISPFENFPYISVRLKNVQVFETKSIDTLAIIDVKTAYIGFDFWQFIKSDFQIKKIVLKDGFINIKQYQNNEYNIVHAFDPLEAEIAENNEPFTVDIDKIHITNIDVKKEVVATKIMVEIDIKDADASFEKSEKEIKLNLDSQFTLNVFKDNKPSYIYHKHLELQTEFDFDKLTHIVNFEKSTLKVDGAEFDMIGTIDIDNEMFVDLAFSGKKPNFDLLIAFAPEDLIPTLKSYENLGKIYFDAQVKGKTANNQNPAINATFGCKDGYIKDRDSKKVLDKLGFQCTFTNGENHSDSTSVFELKDFSARPEVGKFKANLKVVNFSSPEIDMRLDADLDLDFFSKFFKLKDLKNLSGQVLLTMNFHDIIDLQQPEKALKNLNQAYFSKLQIKNLNFKSDKYHLPLSNLNVDANVTGENLDLKNCSFNLGKNDLAINGKISNIPAIIHKLDELILAELHIKSNKLDINQLLPKTDTPSTIDEIVSNLKFDLNFTGKANTFTTSKSLPIGNYYVTNIAANLKNYHHQLNGLNGVFYINDKDVLIKRFDGKLDTSDFHFDGKIGNYDLWLSENKIGDTTIDFDLTSKEIHFKDIFTYKGNNFMPEEYRNEDVKNLKLHGNVSLHYQKNILQSTDFYLTELRAKLKMHPLKLHGFNGNMHLENDILKIKNFSGNLGNNDFKVNGTYYVKDNTNFHQLNIDSKRLNINEIITYNQPEVTEKIDHDAVPNIFEKPFPNVILTAKINDLTYEKFHLENIIGQLKIKENHMVFVDKMQFLAASGLVDISGYFNGSNPKNIYLNPDIKLQKVDMDKLFIKFDNFGQDQLISENIHGLLTGRITGKILLHTDLTPMINDSNLQMDVSIENGRLDNFAPMQAMSTYFGDKNLNRIKFDKLENRFTLKNGELSFPNMIINSTLGYLEISGSQSVDLTMDYYVRVPLKIVGKAAFNKLFKSKPKEISPEQEDELIIKDPEKRMRFINIRMLGKPDDFKISLKKNKEIKSGVQFKKTDDFLFDDIESEFQEN